MATLTERPVVRTGKCSLILVIDGRRYRVSPAPPVARGSKIWGSLLGTDKIAR
jgi:hypothetical protein